VVRLGIANQCLARLRDKIPLTEWSEQTQCTLGDKEEIASMQTDIPAQQTKAED
jgi:hypothetical protein